MKKLIVGITVPGSVVLIEGQLKYFADKGYKTYLLAPDDELTRNYCEREGCTLLPVKIERDIAIFSDLVSLIKIIRHFRKVKPDVVNVGTPKMGLLGSLAGWITGVKKRIYTCRGFRFEHEQRIKKRVLMLMEKITAQSVHQVICISQSVKDIGTEHKLFSDSKGVVINYGSSNGLDLDRFSPAKVDETSKSGLVKSLNLNGYFVFGYAGRLIDRKGINELYMAFNEFNAQHPDTRLLFIGSPQYDQITDKSLINEMEKHSAIILAGSQKDVPLYLSVMDVFVLPAWWEGFGNVLIQAAAMEKPVISTTGTGTRNAVKNNFNGLLVKPKSITELKEAMQSLYEDDGLREKLGQNGIEWAKNFDNSIIWEGMDKLYSS